MLKTCVFKWMVSRVQAQTIGIFFSVFLFYFKTMYVLLLNIPLLCNREYYRKTTEAGLIKLIRQNDGATRLLLVCRRNVICTVFIKLLLLDAVYAKVK